ncbi:MAG TPA: acyltransferase [Candidatus Hydrogenedentes bacterium]|nr:acyltransferase [Candidatus Hydrogenedentota bacterium]
MSRLREFIRPKWWWTVFWMRFAGTGRCGRLATRLATWFAPPYKGRRYLARLHPRGFISPAAEIDFAALRSGANVFIDDRVVVHRAEGASGTFTLGDRASLHRDTIFEIGPGGEIIIGDDTHIQPRCLFASYEAPIRIGREVQIAAQCCFYSYDHSFSPGRSIMEQPLKTKGGIVLEDGVWFGVGVIVLDGVRIGAGAVVGAGSVVTRDIPANALAVGAPARVVGDRGACDPATP